MILFAFYMYYDILFWVINLKFLFKNTTKYSEKIYEEFLNFHLKTFKTTYFLYTLFYFFLFIFVIVYLINIRNFISTYIVIFALIGFFIWRYIRPVFIVRKEYQSNKIKKEEIFTFKFYDSYFSIEISTSIFNVNYSQLRKVYMTNSFYYLYIDKTHAFLLDKSTFTKTETDFYSFISEKMTILKFRNKAKNTK